MATLYRSTKSSSIQDSESATEVTGKVGGLQVRENHDSQGKPTGVWSVDFILLEAKSSGGTFPSDLPVSIDLDQSPPAFQGYQAQVSGTYNEKSHLFLATEVKVPGLGIDLKSSHAWIWQALIALVILGAIAFFVTRG